MSFAQNPSSPRLLSSSVSGNKKKKKTIKANAKGSQMLLQQSAAFAFHIQSSRDHASVKKVNKLGQKLFKKKKSGTSRAIRREDE